MTGTDLGPYRVGEKLGQGGMGEVYKAEDRLLARTVALKFLRGTGSDPQEEKRFIREAQACAALRHPNICDLYHVIQESGQLCLVMEYIDGGTLAHRLEHGALPLAHGLDIALQTAAGLAEAHNKRIVHRDIKPGNILLTLQGQAKITDFGIARLLDRSRLTRTGVILGTPHYMSPEQALGNEIDRRSDVWSLAVVLWEMTTGCIPFHGDTAHATIQAIVTREPKLRLAVPLTTREEMQRVLYKALSKRPESRYQHMEDLIVDLRQIRKSLPDPPPLPPPAKGESAPTVTMSPTRPTLVTHLRSVITRLRRR